MQVKLNFSNPSGEAKNFLFILCITFILKTQIYSLKDAIGREMVVYVDTKKKKMENPADNKFYSKLKFYVLT